MAKSIPIMLRVLPRFGQKNQSGEYHKEVTGFDGYCSELKGCSPSELSSARKVSHANLSRLCREITVEVNVPAGLVPDSLFVKEDDECEDDILNMLYEHQATNDESWPEHVLFHLTYHKQHVTTYRGLLNGDTLYLTLNEKQRHGGCPLASLLSYAEKSLECKSVVVCIEKTREGRAAIMRTFMFMGFETLHPDNNLTCGQTTDHVFMAYSLEY